MWIVWISLAIVAVGLYINLPMFGGLPKGDRLTRIKKSPNYRGGSFRNINRSPVTTGSISEVFLEMFTKSRRGLKPKKPLPTAKTNLHELPRDEDLLVWFGHSSYFLQLAGKRFLCEPVFSKHPAPVPLFMRPFRGTNVYDARDIPEIDYLLISHDHWDHLDYRAIKRLRNKIGKIICPLGVGAHFARWRFPEDKIIELDWNESADLGDDVRIHCLPARHFSGRGLVARQSLWASFLVETPNFKFFSSGDGGYDDHYRDIAKKFPNIDLALLDSGQYNTGWKFIHTRPEDVIRTAQDLGVRYMMPVHICRFCLSNHAWDEPLNKISKMSDGGSFSVITPMIGERVDLQKLGRPFNPWWKQT